MEGIKNTKKLKILLILLCISIFVYAFFPTLARYKNRTSYYEISEWDGTVATKYRSGTGTEIDPYIISNGSEFAYFQSQLEHTDYKGVYFKLGNDIVLNKGKFSYDGTISYELDDSIFTNDGADIVSFYISFNVGEPLKELSKVASGGEMSRVMLAFKVHLLKNLGLSTIIFDEIDTGVSGSVAKGMADKLKIISKDTQVLSITHLPIVAAAADNHLFIKKEIENDRTVTIIKPLNYDERVEEISLMISSQKDDITSQRLAEDMINLYKNVNK